MLDRACTGDKRARVVPVNVAYVLETELADERARQDSRRERVLHGLGRVMQARAESWNRK